MCDILAWLEDKMAQFFSSSTKDHDHSGDAGDGGTFDAANLTSGAATDGQVLTADGSSGAAWEDASGGGASYSVYTCILNQSGENDPVATVLENTLGETPTWSRQGAGVYFFTLSEAVDTTKTFVTNTAFVIRDYDNDYYAFMYVDFYEANIIFNQRDTVSLEYADGIEDAFIEVRVYP